MGGQDDETGGTLGRIALKQVRVSRDDAKKRRGGGTKPMNLLVPYLDLFHRLNDEELSRLAQVNPQVVSQLRQQVDEINKALERYTDLLPRLSDGELTRLTRASAKTIRFWRLCQPRGAAETPAPATKPAPTQRQPPAARHGTSTAGTATPGVPTETPVSRTPPPTSVPTQQQTPAPTERPAGAPVAQTNDPTPDPAASQSMASAQLADIDGDPFPGYEGGKSGPDKGGEIEIGMFDGEQQATEQQPIIDPTQSVTAAPTIEPEPDSEDDLEFELSDDDFF